MKPGPAAAPFTVFLDRDGVLNEAPRFQVRSWGAFRFLPGVLDAMARLNRPDVRTCLVTNQPGTGALLSTPQRIHGIHGRMCREIEAAGGRLDRVEVCFTPPPLPSRRRKPRPGMLEDAAAFFTREGGFDRRRAVMVGDNVKDARAAAAFGVPCILLSTTHGAEGLERAARGVPYAAIAPGLPEAAHLILSWLGSAAGRSDAEA